MSNELDLERLKRYVDEYRMLHEETARALIAEVERLQSETLDQAAVILSQEGTIERLRGEVALLKRQAHAEILKTASIGFEGAIPLGHKASIEDAEYWLSVQLDKAKAVGAAEWHEAEAERLLSYAKKIEEGWHDRDPDAIRFREKSEDPQLIAAEIRKKVTL
jgi:hypothetical protein